MSEQTFFTLLKLPNKLTIKYIILKKNWNSLVARNVHFVDFIIFIQQIHNVG